MSLLTSNWRNLEVCAFIRLSTSSGITHGSWFVTLTLRFCCGFVTWSKKKKNHLKLTSRYSWVVHTHPKLKVNSKLANHKFTAMRVNPTNVSFTAAHKHSVLQAHDHIATTISIKIPTHTHTFPQYFNPSWPIVRKSTNIGTLNSAICNFQTWFVRTVMEVSNYCWM